MWNGTVRLGVERRNFGFDVGDVLEDVEAPGVRAAAVDFETGEGVPFARIRAGASAREVAVADGEDDVELAPDGIENDEAGTRAGAAYVVAGPVTASPAASSASLTVSSAT